MIGYVPIVTCWASSVCDLPNGRPHHSVPLSRVSSYGFLDQDLGAIAEGAVNAVELGARAETEIVQTAGTTPVAARGGISRKAPVEAQTSFVL